MRAENITTDYITLMSYEKMYDGYYIARCRHCRQDISRSDRCQIGDKGKNEAISRAIDVKHACPLKPPLIER